MKNRKRIILVAGVAHSGTSVLTKGLETMGISLGPLLTYSNPFEQQKLWEDPDFHTLNLEILGFFGAHLRGIMPVTAEEVDILCNEGFLTKASQLLLAKLPEDQPLGIKDPLFSVLLPFWKKVFQKCHLQSSFVIAVRNPWSIAASEKQHVEKFFWTWISYCLSCLEHSEGHQRLLVDYDELLKNPKDQMKRIAQRLELTIVPDMLASYSNHYVNLSLRHFHKKKETLHPLHFYQKFAMEMYSQLLKVARDEIDFQKLQNPLKQWKKQYWEASALLVLAEKDHAEIEELKKKIQELEDVIRQLHKNINQKSYSIAKYCQQTHQRELKIHFLMQEKIECNIKLLALKKNHHNSVT